MPSTDAYVPGGRLSSPNPQSEMTPSMSQKSSGFALICGEFDIFMQTLRNGELGPLRSAWTVWVKRFGGHADVWGERSV